MPAKGKPQGQSREARSSATGGDGGVAVRFPDNQPPIVGYADSWTLIRRERAFEVLFIDAAASQVLARVVIPRDPLVEHLWTPAANFYGEAANWLKERNIDPVPAAQPPHTLQGTIPIACNVFRFARVGEEAVFEGFYVSPGDVHRAKQEHRTDAVDARPMCHVQASLALVVGLLIEVQRIAKELTSAV